MRTHKGFTNVVANKLLAPAITAIVLLSPAAFATPFAVTQNNSPAALLAALLGTTTGLSNFSSSVSGPSLAFGTFGMDPFGLGNGVVLSTGKVTDIPGVNTVDGGTTPSGGVNDLSTDFGANGITGDSTTLTINFDVDAGLTNPNLFFQFVFGSEEFLEFGGTQFNDSFTMSLNGTNLAKLSDGLLVTVNNLVPAASLIGAHSDYISNPAGASTLTKLDGYTIVETFTGLLTSGSTGNTLVINIHDVGDGILDSAVFIKGGSFGTKNPTVPEPATIALLGIGLIGFSIRRKARTQH